MAHARDDGASGGGFSGFHARTGECHNGYTARIQRRVEVQSLVTDAGGHADALAEIRELQYDTDHARIEWSALLWIHRVNDAEHAADIQHLNDVPFFHRLGQVTGITKQRLTMTECADDDVASGHLRHAAAGESSEERR